MAEITQEAEVRPAAAGISVVVINHNGGQKLLTCLENALQSGGQVVEIILVDNCSTDGSRALVQDRFPRLDRLEWRFHDLESSMA